ncbi:hypothetical protein [Labrys sp. WJW]|uniref:hypothetical protein n=1 Tax=Labrys sp. WJW TaxID=1737983 RepID=UPI00138FAADE
MEVIGQGGELLSEEAPFVGRALVRRRAEFAAGRCAARRALRKLGGPCGKIPRGDLGEPVWPSGYDGSISHDGDFAAAIAYSRETAVTALSIDLIDTSDLARYWEVLHLIRASSESRNLAYDLRSAALLFGAKEAAIKLISPRLKCLVGFEELVASRVDGGFEVIYIHNCICIWIHTFEVDKVIVSLGRCDL